MHDRFGAAYKDVDAAKRTFGSLFMREFEMHKHNFDGVGEEKDSFPYQITLPMKVDENVPHEWYHKRQHRVRVTK
jgi:hypothetical protein